MPHDKKFNPEKCLRLNNPERFEWINPGKLVESLQAENVKKIIDIGAGTGFFTQALSRFYKGAEIYALDIEPLMIEEMKNSISSPSIVPLLMRDNILDFPDNSIDLVWAITVYHEFDQPGIIMEEVKRVLREGGKLLIVDWEKSKESCVHGPDFHHRVEDKSVTSLLHLLGFRNIGIRTDGFLYHYAIDATK